MNKYFGYSLLTISMVFLHACSSKPPSNLEEAIQGEWETIAFKVNVRSANNTPDSSFVFEVKEGEWEEKLQLQHIKTEFKTDNKYEAVYLNLEDELVKKHRGIWNTMGDTLIMIEPDAIYQYKLDWRSDRVIFSSTIDWDGDGLEDDEYMGVYKKIEDTP